MPTDPCMHPKLRGGDAALHDAIRRYIPALDAEAPERLLERTQRQTGVDERAEDHVTRRARETVEIEHLHQPPASRKLNQHPSPRIR